MQVIEFIVAHYYDKPPISKANMEMILEKL